MKARVFFAVVAVVLVGWWAVHTGLQNKADNEGTAALRELISEAQDAIPAAMDRSMYADVDITSEDNRRIVYAFTYLLRQDRTSTSAEADQVCITNESLASSILAAMQRESIRNPELRIEYRHVGGSLDFSCTYP